MLLTYPARRKRIFFFIFTFEDTLDYPSKIDGTTRLYEFFGQDLERSSIRTNKLAYQSVLAESEK